MMVLGFGLWSVVGLSGSSAWGLKGFQELGVLEARCRNQSAMDTPTIASQQAASPALLRNLLWTL